MPEGALRLAGGLGRQVWLTGAMVLAGLGHAMAIAWPLPDWGPFAAGEPLPWLQWLSLVALVLAVRGAVTWRGALASGWLFATAWLTGTFWWLYVSMHVYGGLPAPLAALAVLALAVSLSSYYGVAMALFWRWRQSSACLAVPAFAALWVLAEWARGTWFTGFPWGAAGYAHVDALAVLAPYVGVYGMGAVAAAAAAGAVWWLAGRRKPLGAAGWALWLLVLVWPGAGAWLADASPSWTRSAGTLPVTLLQGNIPQNEKFQTSSGVPLALQWYEAQILAATQAPSARLVVAPETAIPVLPQELDAAYWDGLQSAVRQGASAVMLGIPLGDWEQGYANSVVGWTPQGLNEGQAYRYDKHHLVPFGEFIPPLFRWFTAMMQIPLGDFNRGALGQPTLAWAGQRVAPNVCYEDLFGEELAVSFLDPSQAPTVLVNVSNIAWFGDTVAIDQHRQIARLRARELERPMLRATNTGATAIIDHQGRVLAEYPRLTRGVLHGEVQGREGVTPYARWAGTWGLWPLVLGALALLGAVWPWRRGAGAPN